MKLLTAAWVLAAMTHLTFAQPESPAAPAKQESRERAGELTRRTWTIDGVERIALLHIPDTATKSETPVVFGFHGHGGSARQASRSFRMHSEWPEAIVVYMEGLPTPGALTDPEGRRNGWQNRQGQQGDRDLKFFDAVLESLKKDYKVDNRRIYAMGHSNGGSFTYLLWKARASVFAAFAPSGTYTGQARTFEPKPAMHIAGKNDPLVSYTFQAQTIEVLKKVNGCAADGAEWAKNCLKYDSKAGTPLVTFIHDGKHQYPSEAPALIVKFFKDNPKPAAKPEETKPAEGKPAEARPEAKPAK